MSAERLGQDRSVELSVTVEKVNHFDGGDCEGVLKTKLADDKRWRTKQFDRIIKINTFRARSERVCLQAAIELLRWEEISQPSSKSAQDGLIRRASHPYERPNRDNMEIRHMHLTNVTVNRSSEHYNDNDDKIQLIPRGLELLATLDVNPDRFWDDTRRICSLTIDAMEPFLTEAEECVTVQDGPGAFHILGFDLMLDEDRELWLLEVNTNPSLRVDNIESTDGSVK
ncbi:Tubulin polyglutamylase ttll7, partial [Perkinsus chesapeaki]